MELNMKKAALIVLMMVCTSFTAEAVSDRWTRIFSDADRSVYLDTSSIREQGKYLKAWTLLSNKNWNGRFNSVVSLDYFDCATRRRAVKQQSYHPDVDGVENEVGHSFFEDDKLQFRDAAPTSASENMLTVVCSKKR